MGSIVISIDAELGWGFHDLATPPTHRVESGRRGWDALQSLLDAYGVPATWAVVGHLFEESCDGRHADHPLGPSWFERERGTWANRPDLTRCPDLIRRLLGSGVDHDVGCHTYSHVEFGNASRAVADAELALCREVAAEWGIDMESFVFPRNNVGHLGALADHGFTAYRGRRRNPRTGLEKLAAVVVGEEPPPLVTPRIDDSGLVNVPASLFLYGFEGNSLRAVKPVAGDPILELTRRGIDAAIRRDGLFHVWLHPNNLIGSGEIERFEQILQYIDERRGQVTVETMADVADRVRDSGADAPRVESQTLRSGL